MARYDLERASATLTRRAAAERRHDLWRYQEVLPLKDMDRLHSLGEGWTPLVEAGVLGAELGCPRLMIKDESLNPTGSFKARGLSVAVHRACELGLRSLGVPSAGNAAGALAAYAAACGVAAHVYLPRDSARIFRAECMALGADVTIVDGLITDCARALRAEAADRGIFDVSTLREPFRIEGKKTMGYELAEQLGGRLPDVILYPTGGGTGLIGMWKAFDEMEAMGWIDSKRPRMVSVQSSGCAPIVRAFERGEEFAEAWPDAATVAEGLRVPAAIGDFLILRTLRESNGTAIAVGDDEILSGTQLCGRLSGIFPAPEGGACVAALGKLIESNWVSPGEQVVLFNTGSGLKYAHLFDNRRS